MKISVAICTYNGDQFIEEQIDSVLNQSLKVDEIVVCDDGSTDRTIAILNNYCLAYPNVFKIFRNDKNLKSVKNFEKSIGLCSGDYIFLSDQDDLWVKNKVETIIDFFEKNENISVLATNGYCIDQNSSVHEKYSVWDVPHFLRESNIEFDYFKIISFIGNIATGASMALRKSIIPDIFPFPIIKGFHHDEWIAIIASYQKKFELLNEKLFYYRIHEKQQVGGVFFDKNEKVKKNILKVFNYNSNNLSIVDYKKKLKKLCVSYKKNQCLIDNATSSIDFTKILKEIENLFLLNKNDFKKNNLIPYLFISFTDKLLNKRILQNKK